MLVFVAASAAGCRSNVGPVAAASGPNGATPADLQILNALDFGFINAEIATGGLALSGECPQGVEQITVSIVSQGVTKAPLTPACSGGVWSATVVTSDLPDGDVTMSATAVTKTGNATGSATFVKDTTPPTVQLGPPKKSLLRAGATQSLTLGRTDALSGVAGATFEVSYDGAKFGAPVAVADTEDLAFKVSKLKATTTKAVVRVAVTDKAGNRSIALSQPFVVAVDDGTAALLAPLPGTVIAKVDLGAVGVSGTCARPTQKVSVGLATPTGSRKMVECSSEGWETTLDTRAAADGIVKVDAQFVDESGKTESTAETNIVKDTAVPTVAWLRPLDVVVRRGETIPVDLMTSGTGTEVAEVAYATSQDGTTFGALTPVTSGSAFNLTWPAGVGSSQDARLKVRVTDGAGNITDLVSGPMTILSTLDRWLGSYESAIGHADGLPDEARFHFPISIAQDASYLYVGEPGTIRRISKSDGRTETIIGLYNIATLTDGVGAAASNSTPRGMVVLNGYLYFTEGSHSILRRVDINDASPTFRAVTTVAGLASNHGSTDHASGTSARFRTPWGLATDDTYIYISDTGNHTIRRFDPATTTVTTIVGAAGVAGTTEGLGLSARLNAPADIVFDNGPSSGAQGSLYIADTNNVRIKRYDIATNTVSTLTATQNIVGNTDGAPGVATLRAARGLATDGTYLYVSDAITHVMRRIELATGNVTTIAGGVGDAAYADGTGNTARFNSPTDIEYDAGMLYVADAFNNAIRRVDTMSFVVSRYAGAPLGVVAELDSVSSPDVGTGALLDQNDGIATSDGDVIYFASHNSGTVRRLTLSTNQVTTISGAAYQHGLTDGDSTTARWRQPRGMVKIGGDLYVADYQAHNIRKINLTAPFVVTTIAGSTTGATGSADNADGLTARFSAPIGMTTDGVNYLYVTDNNRRVRRISLTPPHAVTTIAGSSAGYLDHATGTSAQFLLPRGIAYASDKLYVADQSANAIRMIDLATPGNPVTTIAGAHPTATAGNLDGIGLAARFNTPTGLAIDGTTLYISDFSNHLIKAMNLTTSAVTALAGSHPSTVAYSDGHGLNGRLLNPITLALASTKLFIGTSNYGSISTLDLVTNKVDTVAGALTTTQRLISRAVLGHRDGTARVTSTQRTPSCVAHDDAKIYTIDFAGTIHSLERDLSGEVLMAGADNEVGNVDGIGTAARISRSFGCLVHDGFLYFTQPLMNTVRRLDLATNEVETLAGNPSVVPSGADGTGSAARFLNPTGMTRIGDDLFVVDANGSTVRRISIAAGTFGQVTTLAGAYGSHTTVNAIGSAARFSAAGDIVAVGGYLYTADTGGLVVRWIDPATGEVATLAGLTSSRGHADGVGTAARFTLPRSLTTDGVNLFLTEGASMVTRKIRPSSGTVSTLLGTYSLRTAGDYGAIETATGAVQDRIHYVPGIGLLFPSLWTTAVAR